MELGVFSNAYDGSRGADWLGQVRAAGLGTVQLNLSSLCGEMLPATLPEAELAAFSARAEKLGIRVASLAGTFNLIDPDREERQEGLRRFEVLCRAAKMTGAGTILLCTGSRNPESRWLPHPDNNSPEAWSDLLESTETLLGLAQRYGLVLGVEPEPSNVVSTSQKARAYLDTFRSPHLKIVLDGSNLFRPETVGDMERVLSDGIGLLAGDIVQAHAKDFCLTPEGKLTYVPAGKGLLDYPRYLSLLLGYGFSGPLLLHGLGPEDVPDSVGFLRGALSAAAPARSRGEGRSVIFLHGLGGSSAQCDALLSDVAGVEFLFPDLRGHGAAPLGKTEELDFEALATDVAELWRRRGLRRVVLGGISMGAAVAAAAAARFPEEVEALILLRPAWADGPMAPRVREWYARLAGALERGSAASLEEESAFQTFRRDYPGPAGVFLDAFQDPASLAFPEKFRILPARQPLAHIEDLASFPGRALVLADKGDPIHDFDIARRYAAALPCSRLAEVPSKDRDFAAYRRAVNEEISIFLRDMVPVKKER